MLIPLYINLSKRIVRINDFYVYITKYMENSFGNKPYRIIEGFTDAAINLKVGNNYINKNAIMYAGALFEKFGLRVLLDAFCEIDGNYELWLFGNGDMEKEIELYSLRDTRIKYFGNRPNDEILEFEKKAKLLVNPRFTDNEFTKYSFPSKLMEYMSSGTPVLTTKLLGIPDDYFDKMFYIEIENKEGFKLIDKSTGLLRKMVDASKKDDLKEFVTETYSIITDPQAKKAEFALDVLYFEDPKNINTPIYIKEGLEWIEEQLKNNKLGLNP